MVAIRQNTNKTFSTPLKLALSIGAAIGLYFLTTIMGGGGGGDTNSSSLSRNFHSMDYKRQQKEVLWLIYKKMGGDEWKWPRVTYQKHWSDDVPVCDWSGLDCEDEGEPDVITEITLFNMNVEGTIPTEIAYLKSLKEIIIAHNYKVQGTIPTEFGTMTNLEQIQLSNNALTGTLPAELGRLGLLEEINVTGNRLTGTIPESYKALDNLETFLAYANSLTGEIKNESWMCQLRDYNGGAMVDLKVDCDEIECECCSACG